VRRFVPFAVLALVCVIAGLAGTPAVGSLAYVRREILAGEPWRLLTTHLVHADRVHLLWNLAGLTLIAIAVGHELPARAWTLIIVTVGLVSSLGLLLLSPGTTAMAGLSAMLHALLAAGGVAALRRDRRVGSVLLFALVAKLAIERPGMWLAATRFGWEIAIDAHLYGAIAGALAGLLLARRLSNT
jgi:rhomboid family GlyGly-CTERM serine protease